MKYLRKNLGKLICILSLAATGNTVYADANHEHKDKPSFGVPAKAKEVRRVIAIDMNDQFRYTPDKITVKRGQAVKLAVTNSGKIKHELVLGTMDELKEHAALMQKFPGMEHDEPSMLSLPPGGKGELNWRFTKPGKYYYGCLLPGHFEAGMLGEVVVK